MIRATQGPIDKTRPTKRPRAVLIAAVLVIGVLVSQVFLAAAVGEWATWPSPFGASDEIRGLSKIFSSPADGWAVGGDGGGPGLGKAARWDGINWALSPLPAGTNRLNAVFRLSQNDVWAVGDGTGETSPSIVHWTGVAWNPVVVPGGLGGVNLLGVSFNAVNHGWAVGAGGKILFWNGALWSLDASPVPLVDYNDVVIFTNDGWIVGNAAQILRFNGLSWSSFANPCQGDLQSITALNLNDIWVVGTTPSLCHWDGTSWTDRTADLPASIAGVALRSVYAVDEIDVWAVGDNVVGDSRPAIVNYDGQFWRRFDPADIDSIDTADLLAVSMFNGRDGFAVGERGSAGVAKILRFSGPVLATLTSQVTVSTTTTSTSTLVTASFVTSTTTLSTESKIFTSTSTVTSTTTTISTSTSFSFTSTATTTAPITLTTTVPTTTTSTSTAATTILTTITSTLFQTVSVVSQISDGNGWPFALVTLLGISFAGIRRIRIPSLPKMKKYIPIVPVVLLAFILLTQPATATVGSWFAFPSPTTVDLFGSSDAAASPGEVWAVGGDGVTPVIIRYDGTGWGPTAVPGTVPGTVILRSVWRVSATDAWAVGDLGATAGVPVVLRWNGAAWSLTDPNDGLPWVQTAGSNRCGSGQNCGNLHAVMMASASDGWAVGEPTGAGPPTILRFTSGKWEQDPVAAADADVTALTGLTLRGIHVLSTGELWAVGDPNGANPTVLHRTSGGVWSNEASLAGTGYQSPELDSVTFNDIVVIGGSNDRWAVGVTSTSDPVIARFFTTTPNWRRDFIDVATVGAELRGVSGVGVNDVWAVGDPRTGAGDDPLLVHRDITGWTEITPPTVTTDLHAVSMVNANDGWAVGTGGNILRFSGPLTTVTKTKLVTNTVLTTSVTSVTSTSTHQTTSTIFTTTVSTYSESTKTATKTETATTSVTTNQLSTISSLTTTTSRQTFTSFATVSTTVVSVIVVFASGITTIFISTLPPIPGFPWESILAGIAIGLTALIIVRKRSPRP